MYGCPASIAPEPNNYEFISSRSIFFLLASWAEAPFPSCRRAPRLAFSPWTFQNSQGDTKATVPGSPCSSGLSGCCIYLQRRFWSVSPASAPHCVSIQPRSGRQTAPLPFQTAAGRRSKQKALSANHEAENVSTLERDQSKRRRGGTLS